MPFSFPFREQSNGVVDLRLGCSGARMPVLYAHVGSSAVYWVFASQPASSMRIRFSDSARTVCAVSIDMAYHPSYGAWRAYVADSVFTEKAELTYKLESTDEYGGTCVIGEGVVRVNSVTPDGQNL